MIKHHLIKRILEKIYRLLQGVHNELSRKEIFFGMGRVGDKVYIEMPICSMIGRDKVFLGNNVFIYENSRLDVVRAERDDVRGIHIGDNCYIGRNFTILCGTEVVIENDVLIASNVGIFGENHGMDPESEVPYMNQELSLGRVHIGQGTWIGERVMVLPDVSIGNKCIIGSGAVVTKSVPDYSMVVGNPARVIKRYNFETKQWEKAN